MEPTFKSDIAEFEKATRLLAEATLRDPIAVAKHRVSRILNRAVANSEVQDVAGTRKGASFTINSKKTDLSVREDFSEPQAKRRTWVWDRGNDTWYLIGSVPSSKSNGRASSHRYPTWLWPHLRKARSEARSEFLKEAKARKDARGLGPRGFVEMGKDLGLNVSAPAYIKSANWKGRTYSEKSTGSESTTKDSYQLAIVSSSLTTVKQRKAFEAAVRGANEGLRIAISKSSAKTIKDTLSRFVGAKVS